MLKKIFTKSARSGESFDDDHGTRSLTQHANSTKQSSSSAEIKSENSSGGGGTFDFHREVENNVNNNNNNHGSTHNDMDETGSHDTDRSGDDPNNGMMVRLSLDGDLLLKTKVRPDARLDSESESLASGKLRKSADGVIAIEHESMFGIEIGMCSRAGWEPSRGDKKSGEVRKVNQDTFCVHSPLKGSHQIFCAVFDGHGAEGRQVSHSTRDCVTSVLLENVHATAFPNLEFETEDKVTHAHRVRVATLSEAFAASERRLLEPERGIEHLYSGTTAISVWIFGSTLYCGCVGDSRAVLGRIAVTATGREKMKAIDLSYDQKPTRPDEKKRVRASGGRIARWRRNVGPLRVWQPREWVPGLAMCRSVGDTILTEYGVVPTPEVTLIQVSSADSFFVLASDGVWEFMSSQEVVDFISKFRKTRSSADEAAESLVREAVRRWRRNDVVVDDVTAIVGFFARAETPSRSNSKKSGMFGMGTTTGDKPMLVTETGKLEPFVPRNDVG